MIVPIPMECCSFAQRRTFCGHVFLLKWTFDGVRSTYGPEERQNFQRIQILHLQISEVLKSTEIQPTFKIKSKCFTELHAQSLCCYFT
jgi:hypothetical protein